jgi:hypothetical protein
VLADGIALTALGEFAVMSNQHRASITCVDGELIIVGL